MHAQEKGVLGDFPNQMSQVNEMSGLNGTSKLNGTSPEGDAVKPGMNIPIAICGMAVRLPGGIASPQQLWDFLLAKGDARGRVPESRYNILAYHSNSGRPGTIKTEYGYFLADSVKLGSLDTSRFSFTRGELEAADPQHRQMLEVVRECFDDAGEVGFRGRTIGCYMGSYGEDWLEIQNKDPQRPGLHRVDGYGDFMQSNRVSYELDLRGPRYEYQNKYVQFHGLTSLA
jgi:acyl transferase domain-containing protein